MIDESLFEKDELYMQSRKIKDLANKGKTRKQICEELSISSIQLRYRIETRFNEKTAKKILNQIIENGNRKKTRKSQNVKGRGKKQSFEYSKKILVVDTSAFKKRGSIEFMMQFNKIILLLDVLDEMDRYKEKGGVFGANIKRFLRESAADVSGEKIEVHINEKIDSYTDKNIINYCIGKENVVLYTADNALANRAKAYHIEYIMAEDNEQLNRCQETKSQNIDNEEETEESKNSCEKLEEEPITLENEADRETEKEIDIEAKEELIETENVEVNTSEIVKNIYSNFVKENSNESIEVSVELTKVNVSNVHMVGKNLCLELPDTTRIRYIVIGKDDKEKKPLIGTAMIKLEIGDKILVMVYKPQKYQGLGITMFEITDLRENEHAVYQEFHCVNEIEEIERLRWQREVKNTIRNYFSLVKRI